MMASTISVASAVRTVHWISGGTSASASFTATWLKPQVTQSSTTTAMRGGVERTAVACRTVGHQGLA